MLKEPKKKGVKEVTFLIGMRPHFPTITRKLWKENKEFKYCIILTVLYNRKHREVCHIDNQHDKGDHIHIMDKDGKEERSDLFDFNSIYSTEEYLSNNFMKLIREWEK